MRFAEALKLAEEGRCISYGLSGLPMRMVVVSGVKQLRYVDESPVTLSSHVFFSDYWCERIEGHDFAWARQQLEAGRDVCRLSTGHIRTMINQSGGRLGKHVMAFSLDELDANDWVLAKEQP